MPKLRIENWLLLAAAAVGVVVTFVLGLREYMGATAEVLHPAPQSIPSTVESAPAAAWTAAVARAREATRAALSAENLPGLSVAVGADGELVWAEGFGWADLEQRSPVTPDTRFRAGTASIALTSVAAGRLVEQGLVRLDDEIQTYVPAFPRQAQAITLRQLMGHTAGLRTDGGDEGPLLAVHCDRPADAVPHFASSSLRSAPGAEFRLSAYGWILVSAAIESAAGEPFLRVMRKQVFEPAGMHDTVAESAGDAPKDVATFYFPRFGADPAYGLHGMRPLDYSCYAGASVFLTTAADLVRFGLAVADGTLLQPDTRRLLQTAVTLPSGQDSGYGLGWDLETVTIGGEALTTVGHDGDVLGGMAASLLTVPDRGLVVAVLSNISYAKTSALATRLAEAFADANGVRRK